MNRFKAVIYDCDGVMFDSFEANFAFYGRIMAMMGKPSLDRGDRELMRILHTFASREVFHHIFPDAVTWGEAMRCASSINYRELTPFMLMEEGFIETLDLLLDCMGLAVCTNRCTSINAVLECFNLGGYFDIVMNAAKVENPKPHPEPLLKIIDHFRIDPDEALFVGDSEVDRQTAVAAGVPFVAYKADLPGFARIDSHREILPLVLPLEERILPALP
jgi:phosphoglycolate phosphatase-like HAD superfamily hydrolase